MSYFKTKFCWWPVKLARHVKEFEHEQNGVRFYKEGLEFIGWVWLQRANLTNNLNHGWVAMLDSKRMPRYCKSCGQVIPGDK